MEQSSAILIYLFLIVLALVLLNNGYVYSYLFRCFCAVPYKGKLYVFGGESEKVNKKMKMRGKRELNRSVLW